MAKDSPKPKPKTETPFQRFERLARKIAKAPKRRVDRVRDDKKKSQDV